MTCPSVSRMETTGQSTVSGIFVEMVEEFLDRTGTPPGVFGREAVGAPDFELVHLVGEEELRRERWSLTVRFDFPGAIPQELVVHRPMGLLITCLQADRAPVTGEER